jgi:hypothetical protein
VRASLSGLPYADRIVITSNAPLYPLFRVANAAVVLASTVGIEALMFGVPLASLEIPGWGFAFNYVEKGVAQGLCWSQPMAPQVNSLLKTAPNSSTRASYLDAALANRKNATQQLAALIAASANGTMA